MKSIQQEISNRMNLLKITPEELATKSFIDIEYLTDILEGRLDWQDVEEFEKNLICSVLCCEPEYFTDITVRENDFLYNCNNDENCPDIKTKIQNFLSDFAFLSKITSSTDDS